MVSLRPIPDAAALLLELEGDEREGPTDAGDGARAGASDDAIERCLIVAELHIGLETTLSRSGAHVRTGSEQIAQSLIDLAHAYDATRIIVAGDFKQTVPALTWQERREVPRVLEMLAARLRVDIVLGNHDGDLRSLVPPLLRETGRVRILDPEGYVYGARRPTTPPGSAGADGREGATEPTGGVDEIDGAGGVDGAGGIGGVGGVGVFHGHAWPDPALLACDELVSAHTHPAVALVDDMGHAHIERCWVRGPLATSAVVAHYGDAVAADALEGLTMTLVPPYNPLLGGAAVNVDGLLGPAGKMMALDDAELFLLDGTRLGRISHLPDPPAEWLRRRKRPSGSEL